MIFSGISRDFDLSDEQQYETIGQFWDEMARQYGLESLMGLGYRWQGNTISYAIGLKDGEMKNCNMRLLLPDDGWMTAKGQTDDLKAIYDEIYQNGKLQYEIETFFENGTCEIRYYRVKQQINPMNG